MKHATTDTAEQEAVAAVRDALARVIAEGNHSDRSCAIDAIQAIDRGWHDAEKRYTVSFRLKNVFDARFSLLGSFTDNTDELSSMASTQMQTALYAVDQLASVLLRGLVAVGMGIYPKMDSPPGEMHELPRAQRDTLLRVVDPDPDN